MKKNNLNDKGIICIDNKYYGITLKEIHFILDDVEKEYLGNVIKPFKKDILYVKKDSSFLNLYCIVIKLRNTDGITLPLYSRDSDMYKGMEDNREYTLEELGL